MGVYKQKDSNHWSYRFRWNNEEIRKSTKQSNRRVAEQMEAAHKTALAKGEVGIVKRSRVPAVGIFAKDRFLPAVLEDFKGKPKTAAYYRNGVNQLRACKSLANLRLDRVTSEDVKHYVKHRREKFQAQYKREISIASLNRELQVLRRMFALAEEWGVVDRALVKVKMLSGENKRERVLSPDEEKRYLEGANEVGNTIIKNFNAALDGIRAKRGEQPQKPKEPFLARDVFLVLIDCALRPEECFRLRWDNVRDGALHIDYGKTKNARRRVPMTPRVAGIIAMREQEKSGPWVFPSDTKSGHIEPSTVRTRHRQACEKGGVEHFELYVLRHTCLTRWAPHMDPWTLHKVAGHQDMSTTKRYVHPDDQTVREAMKRAAEAQGGHNSGHSAEKPDEAETVDSAVIN